MQKRSPHRSQWIAIVLAVMIGGTYLAKKQRSAVPKDAKVQQPGGPTPHGDRHKLVAYSYSSFVSSWGPGPKIVEEFTKECQCEVELVDVGDAGLLIQRLLLEKERSRADVVIGLDQLSLFQAEQISWRDVALRDPHWDSAFPYPKDGPFVPFDWSALAFVFRQGEVSPPTSLDDLLDSRFEKRITLQDPRTSTPGLQFLLWVMVDKGVDKGFSYLKSLKKSIHSVSSSWSSSYGLFQKGQAQLTFSYLTSPVYHWMEENKREYQAAIFSSGHPVQVEYSAIPKGCHECELGEKFVRFLLDPKIQKLIMNHNYMLPVIRGITQESEFAKISKAPLIDLKKMEDLSKRREEFLKRWANL